MLATLSSPLFTARAASKHVAADERIARSLLGLTIVSCPGSIARRVEGRSLLALLAAFILALSIMVCKEHADKTSVSQSTTSFAACLFTHLHHLTMGWLMDCSQMFPATEPVPSPSETSPWEVCASALQPCPPWPAHPNKQTR